MRRLAHAGVVFGWLLIAYGALWLAAVLPVLFMLVTGQVQPGKPYWVDDLAPTTQQAFISTLSACVVVVVGFGVKAFSRKHRGHQPNGT